MFFVFIVRVPDPLLLVHVYFSLSIYRSAILGVLLSLILTCHCLQYQPIEFYGGGEECALILNNIGRTSAYDYTYNLLRGTL